MHDVAVEAQGDALPGQVGADGESVCAETDYAVAADGAVDIDRGVVGQSASAANKETFWRFVVVLVCFSLSTPPT